MPKAKHYALPKESGWFLYLDKPSEGRPNRKPQWVAGYRGGKFPRMTTTKPTEAEAISWVNRLYADMQEGRIKPSVDVPKRNKRKLVDDFLRRAWRPVTVQQITGA